MFGLITAVLGFGTWCLKIWRMLYPSTDRQLGRAEVQRDNAQKGLDEVRKATEAGDTQRAADNGRLLDGSSPAARGGDWTPHPD